SEQFAGSAAMALVGTTTGARRRAAGGAAAAGTPGAPGPPGRPPAPRGYAGGARRCPDQGHRRAARELLRPLEPWARHLRDRNRYLLVTDP
ncbi:hypothetical protein, partial [Nocardia abscessus]|uniref:hypothetical protein n=1 Tax=Nocardia abscessus TaxID=120957 RepID=UPI002456993E